MAAKVVMVAVPAVLGAASIRVYRVSDGPTEGLITQERLNIYNPLQQSCQVQVAPEEPGIIERRLCAARQTIVPVVQAAKGAYISVKRGTVNVYHAGQDVYYYLKDPPPEFIPRFGTITMAGLLGMFLARKGSRLKRVALPLGLMSAGASVCYPAHAVAVLKVTGNKVYAAGQWSSATLSSLFSSPPQPSAASQSQEEAKPIPEPVPCQASEFSSPARSEAGEKPSAPSVSEESIVIEPADQASTEPSTDLVVNLVVAETETMPLPEELPVAVEREKPQESTPKTEQVSPEAFPSEPTPRIGPVESAPSAEEPATPSIDQSAVVDSAEPELTEGPQVLAVEETLATAPSEEAAAEISKVLLTEAVVESAEPEAELAVGPLVAPVEEPSAETPPPSEEPAADNTKDAAAVEETTSEEPAAQIAKGSTGFKPDPALMDFGQSNPEDEDLYSTRS